MLNRCNSIACKCLIGCFRTGELQFKENAKGSTIKIIAYSCAHRSIAGLFAVLLAALPLAASAAPPSLILPLACALNRDCWIANHVDLDPGSGIRDYACGDLTYDGHKGTDFAIRDRAAMEDGVAVLAAAAGRVRAGRDGLADVSVRVAGKESTRSREFDRTITEIAATEGIDRARAGGPDPSWCPRGLGRTAPEVAHAP